jgi:hypothetical protein
MIEYDRQPQVNDVLLGRHDWPGSQYFGRLLIKSKQARSSEVAARDIIRVIGEQDPPGRFFTSSHFADQGDGGWTLVCNPSTTRKMVVSALEKAEGEEKKSTQYIQSLYLTTEYSTSYEKPIVHHIPLLLDEKEPQATPTRIGLHSKEMTGKGEKTVPHKVVRPVKATKPKPPSRKKKRTPENEGRFKRLNGNDNDGLNMPRGVTMRPSGKWQAQIYFCGKSRYLGVFATAPAAAVAFEAANIFLKSHKNADRSDKETTNKIFTTARRKANAAIIAKFGESMLFKF